MKKISCVLLAFVLLCVSASCGGSKEEPSGGSEDKGISFVTTDLKGNSYSSEDIFKEHDITLVNLWGTYCGPCIREMPDLQILDERLKEKNCAVVGIVIDVPTAKDSGMVRTAEAVIEETGVKYLNLVYWDGIFEVFPAEFIPTTYLVDSDGNILGEPSVGARGADEYEKLVDDALKKAAEQ